MLLGFGAIWQSFLGFAVYDVLGKIRIPCLGLTSLLRSKALFQSETILLCQK